MHTVVSLINDVMKSNNVELQDKAKLTEVLVAEYLACKLAIPTSPAEDPRALFITQHKVGVLKNVHLVNEIIVLDVDGCVEKVYKLWLIRYKLVHQPNLVNMKRLMALAVATDFAHLPKESVDLINKYPGAYLNKFKMEEVEHV